jgi:hypothetical protein
MGSLGCVDLTVTAMTTYTPSSEGVAHFGLKTLSNLSFGCEDNRAVAGVKGSDAILRAMAQYPDNAGLQGDGCGALTNISHGNDANKRSIAQRGGVESVLNAMEVRPVLEHQYFATPSNPSLFSRRNSWTTPRSRSRRAGRCSRSPPTPSQHSALPRTAPSARSSQPW